MLIYFYILTFQKAVLLHNWHRYKQLGIFNVYSFMSLQLYNREHIDMIKAAFATSWTFCLIPSSLILSVCTGVRISGKISLSKC